MPFVSEDEKALMRSDYVDTELDHLCVVERNVLHGKDPHGHPLPSQWIAIHSALPCRLWSVVPLRRGGGDMRYGPNVDAVVPHYEMELPYGTDIKEDDRIASVTELDGHVKTGPLVIDSVRHSDLNVRLLLVEGRPPRGA